MVVTRTFVLDRPPPLAGLDYLAPPLDSDLAQVSSLFAFGIDVIVLTAVITWASLRVCVCVLFSLSPPLHLIGESPSSPSVKRGLTRLRHETPINLFKVDR